MFKTNSRKGIASAAVAALALAGLVVSAPAQAAVGLNVEPNKGSTYSVAINDRMDIKVYTDGIATSVISSLKFKLTTDGSNDLKYNTATTSPAGNTNATAMLAGTTSNVVSATTSAGAPTILSLAIGGVNYTSASEAVTVVAFLDANGDDLPNDSYVTEPITVNFVDGDLITWTTEFATPTLGAASVEAFLSTSDINLQAVNKTVNFYFVEGSTQSVAVTGAYNATAGKFKATATSASFTAASSFSTSGTVSALVYQAGAQFDSVAVGTTISRTVGATDVTGVLGVSSSATATNTGILSGRVTVSPAATAVTLTAKVVSGSAVLKDKTVSFKFSELTAAGMDSASTLTANGTAITFANAGLVESKTVTVVTDAKGIATITLAIAGVKKTNAFNVQASIDGVNSTTTTVYTFTEAAAASVDVLDMVGDSSETLVVAKDATFNLNLAVLDTYGALIGVAGHSVQVSDGTATISAAVVDGKAVVTWPGFATVGSKSLTATVLKSGAATTATPATILVKVGTAGVAASLTQTATALGTATVGITLNDETWADADTRIGQVAPDVAGGVTLTGAVKDANGNAIVGADVTLTGTGVQFNADNKVYKAGSITVKTNASGVYSVVAYSNLTGKKTVTITSGAASKEVTLYHAAAAYSAGETLTITTNAVAGNVEPGSTVRATVKLVDAFGNPVKVTNEAGTASFVVTVTGPGFVSALPTATNASGEATLNILLGSKDSGSIVITASYDGDDTGTVLAAVSATSTLTIGAATTAPSADKKLTVGTFNGYIAIYAKGYEGQKLSAKVAGKWLTVEELSSFQRVVRKTGAGYSIKVDLYIDGVFAQSSTTVTK